MTNIAKFDVTEDFEQRRRLPGRHMSRHVGAVTPAGSQDGAADIAPLLFFLAVAETLSFTKAALRLQIDQSWLSYKIRQFESSLGLTLFVRSTRNVELTRAGVALLEPARRLAEVAGQARVALDTLRASMISTVRVGALPFSFADPQRTALLDRFMSAHPDILLTVSNGPTPTLVEQVRAGRLDLAFVSAPFDATGLDVLLLREDRYYLLMREGHPLAALPTLTAAALRDVRIVVQPEHFSPAAHFTYYRPLIEAGITAVAVPEFQCAVTYAAQWGLPVMCTGSAADNYWTPGLVTRRLEFVPACKKFLIRLSGHRTPSQNLLWEMASTSTRVISPLRPAELVTRSAEESCSTKTH